MNNEIKVTQLPSAEQITQNDLLMIVQNDENKKATSSQFLDMLEDDLENYYTKTETDALLDDKADISDIPSNDNLVNVGSSVDNNYRTNILYSHNLFDKNNANELNAYFVDGTNNITADTSGNNKTIYIPCKPNTTYTIQKNASPSNRAIGYTTTTPAVNVAVQGATNILANTTSKIITTGNNAQYLVIRVWSGTQDTITFQEMLDSVMINEGSEATTYEPYITPSIWVDGEEIYNTNIMNYSTNEQVIGKWIDGKPLYRKVIDFGSLPNATTKAVAHNISNIDKIVKIDGITYSNQNYSPLPLVYNSSEAQYNTEIYVGGVSIAMKTTQNRSNITAFVYLEYTKTTD